MSLLSMLKTTGTLQRKTAAKDASGGYTTTYADVQSNVKCDIQPASGSIRDQYMQHNMFVTHTVYLASDVTAKEGDRWSSNSRIFLVRGYRKSAPGYLQWPCILDVEEQP